MDNRQAHPTKKGPGRKHGHKVPHGTPPKPAKGAFMGQRSNAAKADRREKVARMGRRQAIKFIKFIKFIKLAKREPTNPAVQGF